MNLGIDLDGTLFDCPRLMDRAYYKLSLLHGISAMYRRENYDPKDKYDLGPITIEEYYKYFNSIAYTQMKSYKRMINFVNLRHSIGDKITIITHRDKKDKVLTGHQLNSFGIKYDSLIIGSSVDKRQVCADQHIDYMFDDYPILVGEISKVVKGVFVVEQPYNKNEKFNNNVFIIDHKTFTNNKFEKTIGRLG